MITIHSKLKDYSIEFSEDLSSDDFLEYDFTIVDAKVYKLHLNIFPLLSEDRVIAVEVDEGKKTLEFVSEVLAKMVSVGLNKHSKIAAIGGGVIQDLSGFVANIYFRGVAWDYFPSTLLAMGDSCIGGKTSINFMSSKNILGTFYPPEKIVAYIPFLSTLPRSDYMSGLSEVVKINLVEPDVSLHKVVGLASSASVEDGSLSSLIESTLQIKKDIIEEDEFDTGKRNLLNFGHCVGHALENTSHFTIPHGLAVLVGMGVSAYISSELGFCSSEFASEFARELDDFYLVDTADSYLVDKEIISLMLKDKKRIMDGLSVVCPLEQGGLRLEHDISINVVTAAIEKYKGRFLNEQK